MKAEARRALVTWDDIVETEKIKYISINHQIQYRRIDGKVIQYASETKTSSGKRRIPITPEVAEILAEGK